MVSWEEGQDAAPLFARGDAGVRGRSRMGRALGGGTCVCVRVLSLLCSLPPARCFCGFPPQLIRAWRTERRAAYTLLGILLGSSQEKLKLTWMKNWTSGLEREYAAGYVRRYPVLQMSTLFYFGICLENA